MNQYQLRQENHKYSEKSKQPKSLHNHVKIQVGDLVYLYSEKQKLRARDRYLVVSVDGDWCFIKKFVGSQLRATSYKVKCSECYRVESEIKTSIGGSGDSECEDDIEVSVQSPKCVPCFPNPECVPPVLSLPSDNIGNIPLDNEFEIQNDNVLDEDTPYVQL